jgi:hypothetical protein
MTLVGYIIFFQIFYNLLHGTCIDLRSSKRPSFKILGYRMYVLYVNSKVFSFLENSDSFPSVRTSSPRMQYRRLQLDQRSKTRETMFTRHCSLQTSLLWEQLPLIDQSHTEWERLRASNLISLITEIATVTTTLTLQTYRDPLFHCLFSLLQSRKINLPRHFITSALF